MLELLRQNKIFLKLIYEGYMVGCSFCGADIELSKNIFKGKIVDCKECGVELEISSVKPLKLREVIEDDDLNIEDDDYWVE